MRNWLLIPSLVKLRDQINAAHPGRNKDSDGTIGDEAHAQTVSDHNPDANGWVRAFDCTHDPAHGVDIAQLAEQLRVSRDERIKYVIANGRMFSSYPTTAVKAWQWRPYNGPDMHTNHVHVSVVADSRAASTRSWAIGPAGQEDEVPLTPAEIKAIGAAAADAVWSRPLPKIDNPNKETAASQLAKAMIYGYRTNKAVAALLTEGYAKQLAAVVVALLPKDQPVDVDQLARSIVVELVREGDPE